jgi:hypothetical protein
MAYVFGDGMDCYAAVADMGAGYWDSVAVGGATLVAGRFAGSQALSIPSTSTTLAKSSAVNDAVHHIVIAFRQTTALSGTTLGIYFQLTDIAANQCCIVFRSDGTVLLTSATPGGTVLATYAGAVTANNTWFGFEFEVIINNTTGRFRARKNGNTVDDFDSGAVLNTRPGANSYANKLTVSNNSGTLVQQFDDLLWRSDASSVPWVGDIRCYTRMPASDAAVQFARSPNPATLTPFPTTTTAAHTSGNGNMVPFTAPYTGTIGTLTVSVATGGTGNMKCAFYDSARSAVVGVASNAVVNPITGVNTVTFATPVPIVKGTLYHLAFNQDFSITYNVNTSATSGYSFTTAYASFPATAPTTANGTSAAQAINCTLNITPTINAEFVNETLQDGTTSYVFDAVVNDADFYTIAALASTPATVVAVTTRGFIQKSDAGTRGAAVQLKSGATTVTSTPTLLSSSFGWLWRTDLTDPATGSAWTAAGVNNVTIGPKVTS